MVILYVYVCLWQITGGSGGNLVCLCLFVSTDRGHFGNHVHLCLHVTSWLSCMSMPVCVNTV